MIYLLLFSMVFGYILSWILYVRQQNYSRHIYSKIEPIYAKKIANKQKIALEKVKSLTAEYENLKQIISQKYSQNIQSLLAEITYEEKELQNREEYLAIKEKLFIEKKLRSQKEVKSFNLLISDLDHVKKIHKERLLQRGVYDIKDAKKEILEKTQNDLCGEMQILLRRQIDTIDMRSEEIVKNILATVIQRSTFGHWHNSYPNNISLTQKEVLSFLQKTETQDIFQKNLKVVLQFNGNTVTINESDGYCREITRKILLDMVCDHICDDDVLSKHIQEKIRQYKQKTIGHVERNCKAVGIFDFPDTLAWYMGRLKYRTSFGQNILGHSFEVAMIAWRISGELGFKQQVCKRAAFLHDIGKATDHEESGGHSSIGEQILKEAGEAPEIIEGVVEHHEDVTFEKPYAAIVNISDAISASRPGARRETFEKYIKKLQKLEAITTNIDGIIDAYTVSAGREIRVVVEPDVVDDQGAKEMAEQLALAVGKEILYSGVVRITVIREKTFEVYT